MQARASARWWTVVAELPRLVATAVRISWRADRTRTADRRGATVGAGSWPRSGCWPPNGCWSNCSPADRRRNGSRRPCRRWPRWRSSTAVRGGLGIATGYAQNGLTPRVDREVERGLFEVTTAVRLDAFDEDAFADDMERATRGTDSAIALVQGAMHLLAGLVGLLAVAVAVIVIHPLLLLALLVATVPQRVGRRCGPATSGTRPTSPARCGGAGCGSCTG